MNAHAGKKVSSFSPETQRVHCKQIVTILLIRLINLQSRVLHLLSPMAHMANNKWMSVIPATIFYCLHWSRTKGGFNAFDHLIGRKRECSLHSVWLSICADQEQTQYLKHSISGAKPTIHETLWVDLTCSAKSLMCQIWVLNPIIYKADGYGGVTLREPLSLVSIMQTTYPTCNENRNEWIFYSS